MGWARKVVGISSAALCVVVLGAGYVFAVSTDEEAVTWMSGPVSVLSSASTRASWYPAMPCTGREELVAITGVGLSQQACVYGESGYMQMARYVSSQSRTTYAIKHPFEAQYHEVRGLCVDQALCTYNPHSDVLITQYPQPVHRYGAAVYSHFSDHITRQFDLTSMTHYYEYTPNTEPHLIALGDILPTVGALAFSSNGKWAVFEINSYGFARLNTETMELRRIAWPGRVYGHGNDPLFEVAISNDGRYVAASERNAGLSIYEVTDGCGLVPSQGANTGVDMGSGAVCSVVHPNLWEMFEGFGSAYMPQFSPDGLHLTISLRMNNNTTQRVLLGAAGAPHQAIPYIALGDSFTSGEGETNDVFYKPLTNSGVHTCHTSMRSYPYLLAGYWGVSSESVACSGARTLDVIGAAQYTGQGERIGDLSAHESHALRESALHTYTPGVIRQVEFISRYTPQVVTLGIGGNDVGMIDKLKACVALSTCEWARDPEKRLAAGREVQRLYTPLRSTGAAIKQASPATAIVLVGYPRVINEVPGAVCSIATGMMFDAAERKFMDETILLLNTVVRQAALAEGVYYGNIEDSFIGHRLCESSSTPAMNEVRFGDDFGVGGALSNLKILGAESFHPTPFGHERIAQVLSQQTWWPMGLIRCDSCEYTQTPALSSYWGEGEVQGEVTQASSTLTPEGTHSPGDILEITLPVRARTDMPIRATLSWGEDIVADFTVSTHRPTITLPAVTTSGYYLLVVQVTDEIGQTIEFYQSVSVAYNQPLVVAQAGGSTRTPSAVIAPVSPVSVHSGAMSIQRTAPILDNLAPSSVLSVTSEAEGHYTQKEFYPTAYIVVLLIVTGGGVALCAWWVFSRIKGG